jgi:hypothetical protein
VAEAFLQRSPEEQGDVLQTRAAKLRRRPEPLEKQRGGQINDALSGVAYEKFSLMWSAPPICAPILRSIVALTETSPCSLRK